MKKQIGKPVAASRLDRQTTARTKAFFYRRQVAAPRALFAAPSPDLLTLVIGEAIKRQARREVQHEALRDALYDMPVSPARNDDDDDDDDDERGADIHLPATGR